ncbi:MAG: DUF2779 domain-containing protein [Candidatus Saccharibacteria bacterium]|nr:DUF2779 domain-containing protein [Candidatus Saccharibacteria bacterium]
MDIKLTKTEFQNYRKCPCFGWHEKHKKLPPEDPDSRLKQIRIQGYQVEALATKLFAGGWKIEGNLQDSIKETKRLIHDSENEILYQATACTPDKLLAKADIVALDRQNQVLDIYEVKQVNHLGNQSPKTDKRKYRDYLADISFQKFVFEASGYKIRDVYLIHLNPDYRLDQDVIEVDKFFEICKQTNLCNSEDFEAEIQEALECYKQPQSPKCECRLKPKKYRCPTFKFFNPDLPIKNSILDIARITPRKIEQLLDMEVKSIEQIDLTSNLESMSKWSERQKTQIKTIQTQKTIIIKEEIDLFLKRHVPPLYFLDYEAIGYPIPTFEGSKPHQAIPFQFSLHLLDQNERLTHYEYLMAHNNLNALKKLVANLQQSIKNNNCPIVVWHKGAEKSFQKNITQLLPETSSFFKLLTKRFCDLEEIFTKQYYVDPGFAGRTSLKDIVPVLVPHLDYGQLAIHDGQMASVSWDEALISSSEQREEDFQNLKKYCHYDTLTMVEIYQFLRKLINNKKDDSKTT